MRYDPDHDPGAETWLALSDDERLEGVLDYHQSCDDPLPESGDWALHSHLHVIVENQLAMDDPPAVRQALDRLTGGGLSRHDAVHAVGGLLGEHLHSMLQREPGESDWQDYERALATLSADTLTQAEDSRPPQAGKHLPSEVPDRLQALLDPQRDHDALGYCEACGFLFAVAGSPEPIAWDDWLAALLDGFEFESDQQTATAQQDLVTLYRWINDQIHSESPELPPGCHLADDPLRNFDSDAGFGRWCLGFVTAFSWLSEVWKLHEPDEDEAFGMAITALSFFSGREIADDIYNSVADRAGNFEAFAGTIVDLVPEALGLYAGYGLEARQRAISKPTQPVRSNKVGRNQPCPCGSGKKFKKCCGRPH